ncbi:extracellular solute-binding protein [Paenibacillus rhizovicinus]|uniref:Extracellular solute-binding protein n=1 Tax=Paenibacillus rhizovicinus TaxID=2704463 RepID=A0A6C0NUR9_9BACL|nr:extracellular solute-binding protein [Paenibacillus rhizovicinus]QHW29940.1 extracellular solute-binding protein [Paenibacillus rhizovicinus]
MTIASAGNTRKYVAILSGVLLLGGLLAGCGSSNDNDKASSSANNSSSDNQPSAANNSSNANTNADANAPSTNDTDKPQEKVKLTLLIDNQQDTVNVAKALVDAFQAKNPNITIETETRPAGSEGDNFVKTRLSTGDMNDVFFYNSGSLMQALNPEQNILDVTGEPWEGDVIDSFKQTVTFNGKQYGAPYNSSMGGGWFYNKKIYAQLGLSVPKTWDELMANTKKIKEAGITAIIGTYKDSWTSQLIMLADYYNVQAEAPTFAADYTANKAKYATTPAALRGFEKLQETAGYMNKDYLAANLDAGLKMLAEGKGAQYPMLTFVIPTIAQNNPDNINDIGFFAQPGDSADKNGLTVWMPGAAYIYKNGQHLDEAKKFVAFIASPEGMAVVGTVSKPTGPYVIKGAAIPDDVPQVVKDMLPYFDSGMTAPALEFVSPVKGPNLPQITVEVGSGHKKAADAAADYDKDVEKQAQQLGLAGW